MFLPQGVLLADRRRLAGVPFPRMRAPNGERVRNATVIVLESLSN